MSRARPTPATARRLRGICLLLAGLFLAVVGGRGGSAAAAAEAPAITRISAVRQLALPEARRAQPVLLRGTVTYFDPSWNTLFFQDEAAGIYVFAGTEPRARFVAGQRIELEGRTEAAAPHNAVRETRITVLGTGPMPEPRVLDPVKFATGQHDAQWVELEATVRGWTLTFERLVVQLSSGTLHFEAHTPLPAGSPLPPPDFVHSRVRLHGVAGSVFDSIGKVAAVRLYVPSLAEYHTLLPAPADPFAHQMRSIASLAEGTTEVGTRQLVSGVVTYAAPGEAVILEEAASVWLRFPAPRDAEEPSAQSDPRPPWPILEPGERIRAVGYYEPIRGAPVLTDTLVYRAGRQRAQEPTPLSPAALASGDHVLELVEVEGELRQELSGEFTGGRRRRWILEQDGVRFEAAVPALPAAPEPAPRFSRGSLLRLTGICEPLPGTNAPSTGFRIRLASPADVVLVRPPSRWFSPETVRVLGIAAAGILALLGWALLLWREGGRQRELNRQLEDRIRERTAALTSANERLEREIAQQRRAEQVRQAIYQISEAVHATEDLQSLYRRIHDAIRQLTGAENLYIASYDPEHNLLSFPYYVDEVDTTPPTRPLGKGLTEYVLRTGQPLLATPQVRDALEANGEYRPIGSPAALWLGVPLSLRGSRFGVLAIQEYRNPDAFGEEEKAVLGFVAEQITIAIDRRRAMDELRASEARLRESEERFSKGFRGSPGSLSIIDLETARYLDINEGFTRTYGFTREEALNRTSVEIGLWPEPSHRERLERVLRDVGHFRNEEVIVRRRDGQLITVSLSADAIEIGGRTCVIVSALDITDRKRAEVELLHSLERERELSRLKTNFVSLVSHEFRTPLGVILSSAEILERYHERLPAEERAQQVRSISTSVHRMAHMMNEVLLLGRFDAGRVAFNPALVDLSAFCHRVAEEVVAAAPHDSRIEFEARQPLGHVSADESLLGHVFTNLLSNAVKYSPPGSPIRFHVERREEIVVFEVADQGFGIPEADQPNLFSAFHRGRNVSHVAGTGLGLVIVRRCVDLHGGLIRFISPPGKGTTFTVELPLPVAAPPPDPAPAGTES